MCGICGIVNFKGNRVNPVYIENMMQKMKHRGPDDEGIYINHNIGLGFVRLSILDLSPKGHQPMFDESGRFLIIHNGEVYNYIEIREELKKVGFRFNSDTDTEVILKAWMHWGDACLERFNGMWAFAILDIVKNELFVSRDRYGIKPFYYFADDEQFIFASEIPPMLSVMKKRQGPDYQSIFDYLVFNRTDHTENTFFERIKKLQHGHNIKIKIKDNSKKSEWCGDPGLPGIKVENWYDLRAKVAETNGFDNPDEFRETFSSSIGLRLRSDVPVGVCLSGGLDSSSIVSLLLKDHNKYDINTFSAVYNLGQTGYETNFINEFSTVLRNMHFTSPTGELLYSDIEDFNRAMAEPVPSTAPYAQFKVMELAKDHVVVTLDGQGADEILAGYHYFFGLFFKDMFMSLDVRDFIKEIYYYLSMHKSIYGLKAFFYFLMPEALRTRIRVSEKGYLTDDFSAMYMKDSSIAGRLYGASSLKEALLDHFEYKLEHLLKWEDRNSMWFSLESRVPFLDHRLLEKTLALDGKMKINNGMTKHVLRESMKGILPEKIRTRKDDIGFDTPQDEWFREKAFKDLIIDILESKLFKDRNIVDANVAKKLYIQHLKKKINISKEIWKWVHLELWFREFVD